MMKSAGDKLAGALALEQERAATLKELAEAVNLVVNDWQGDYEPAMLVWRKSEAELTKQYLEKLGAKLEELTEADYVPETLNEKLMVWIDQNGWGKGDVLWPLRVALTGREHSPGPFEVASVLGKTETMRRVNLAKNKIL